jgi:hypothetical protein
VRHVFDKRSAAGTRMTISGADKANQNRINLVQHQGKVGVVGVEMAEKSSSSSH